MKPLFLIGRIVLGGFFIYNGVNHLRNRRGLAQYAASKHTPAPDAAVTISGLMLLAGGISITLGLKPKYGALLLLAFLGTASPAMHDFWKTDDPSQKTNDRIHFMKNMALAGGIASLMGVQEPWPHSIHRPKHSRMGKVVRMARRLAA